MKSSASTQFRTFRYLVSLSVIILVNIRFSICNILEIPTLPITLIIIGLLFIGTDYTRIRKCELIITLTLIALTAINRSAISILSFLLFCFNCREKLRSLLWANLLVMILLFITALFLFKLGATRDHVIINAMKVGHTMGFSNPNILSLYLYAIMLTMYVVWSQKKIYFAYVIMLLIAYLTYAYSGSRTTALGVIAIIITGVSINLLPKSIVRSSFMLYLLPIILISATFYYCIHYKDYFILDVIFSGRLSVIGKILNQLSPTQYIMGFPWPSEEPQDNAFITILASGGIMGFWVYFYLYRRYVRVVKYVGIWSLPIIVSVLLSGLTEYVFVGLNMISITLCLIVKILIKNAESLNNSSCLQCRQIS